MDLTDPSLKCEIGKKTQGNNVIFPFLNGEIIKRINCAGFKTFGLMPTDFSR